MAGLKFSADVDEISVVAATKQTVFQIITATHIGVLVREWSVAFLNGAPTDELVLVELELQTDAGTGGSSGSSFLQIDDTNDTVSTLQTTALQTITGTQPTVSRRRMREGVSPLGGYTWQAIPGFEIYVPAGKRLGFAVTSNISNLCKVRASCEE